jgi:hypothetical protein
MIPNLEVLQAIWKQSKGLYYFIGEIHRPDLYVRGKFDDFCYRSDDVPTQGQTHEYDLFFTPLLFTETTRKNEFVGSPGVLFADLDKALPSTIIPPTMVWSTSPGNLQAVWFLTRPMQDVEAWAGLNQRLTYYQDADPGGWHASKLLRVPGSINWKRRAFGNMISYKPNMRYEPEMMNEFLPRLDKITVTEDSEHPPLMDPKEQEWLLRLHWKDMSLLGRNMITRQAVRDRSLHIVKTARELRAGGLSPEATFNLIWVAPWNKWRVDRHDPERLWKEICAAE